MRLLYTWKHHELTSVSWNGVISFRYLEISNSDALIQRCRPSPPLYKGITQRCSLDIPDTGSTQTPAARMPATSTTFWFGLVGNPYSAVASSGCLAASFCEGRTSLSTNSAHREAFSSALQALQSIWMSQKIATVSKSAPKISMERITQHTKENKKHTHKITAKQEKPRTSPRLI